MKAHEDGIIIAGTKQPNWIPTNEKRMGWGRRETHSCSASRNLSCSGSVQLSRDLVMV